MRTSFLQDTSLLKTAHVQVSQCGNQMVTQFGEVVCGEHGIGGSGEYCGNNDAHLSHINVLTIRPRAASRCSAVNVWLQSRSLPARGRVGLEVHRCLCIIDAGNVFVSAVSARRYSTSSPARSAL
jgi:hypothetical protein